MSYLSPIPTGLFSDSGDMRISKSKSTLKNLTKVDASSRQAAKEATCTVIDGCALLWIPRWPSSTSTKQPLVIDYVNKFKDHIKEKLKKGDTYLVFDKYNNYSTKSSTRIARMAEGCKVFQLSPTAPLPSQKICLTITQNKKQLIDIVGTESPQKKKEWPQEVWPSRSNWKKGVATCGVALQN